jgi:hypothetical protein
MEPLADLFERQTPPEPIATRPPSSRVLKSLIEKRGTETPPAAFENDVFNFLLTHKEALGISELTGFTSSSVDGAVQLWRGAAHARCRSLAGAASPHSHYQRHQCSRAGGTSRSSAAPALPAALHTPDPARTPRSRRLAWHGRGKRELRTARVGARGCRLLAETRQRARVGLRFNVSRARG